MLRDYIPLNPFPLVTPIISTISFLAKTSLIGTFFSKCSLVKSTYNIFDIFNLDHFIAVLLFCSKHIRVEISTNMLSDPKDG